MTREPSRGSIHPAWALCALLGGEFIATFDVSVANVLLPSISRGFDAQSSATLLVVAAYSAVYASLVLASGRLGDMFGFARLFKGGVAIFGVTALACAAAPNLAWLVLGRAGQGLGAALLFPQVLAGIQVALPASWRAAAISLFGAVLGIGATSGQLCGAWLTELNPWGLGWRAAFAINIPVCTGVWVAARVSLPVSKVHHGSLDVPAVALTTLSLSSTVVGLTVQGSWFVPCLSVGALTAGVLVLWERRSANTPGVLFPPDLLRTRSFVRGLLTAGCFYLTQVPFYVMLTQAAQRGAGLSPLGSAALFAVLGACFLLSSTASARWGVLSTRRVTVGASLVMAATFLYLTLVPVEHLHPTSFTPVTVLALNGLCGGFIAPTLVRRCLVDVTPDRAGIASGFVAMVQQVTNSVGTAVAGIILSAGRASISAGFHRTLALFALAAMAVCALSALPTRRHHLQSAPS